MKKKIYLLIFISALCISCSSKANIAASSKSKSAIEAEQQQIALQNAVIDYGMKFLKTPYRYGGTTARGFDCSGFTSYVYKNFGYLLERSSRNQAEQFPFVAKKDLTRGDLVFFEGRSRNGRVGHVGIVTENKGNGEFEFIHSSVNKGVIISSSTEPYYANRYLKAGRVIDQKSFVATASSSTSTVLTDSKPIISSSKETVKENQYISDFRFHIVKKGESLSTISRKYDVPISTLMHLNNLKSKRIKRGQRLMVAEAVEKPNLKFVVQADTPIVVMENVQTKVAEKEPSELIETSLTESSSAPEPTKQDVAKTHKVLVGESLYVIARKYNMSVDELKSLNGLTSNTIMAGQKLKVAKAETQTSLQEENQMTTSSNQPIVHTVKSGETLYAIARTYQCTVKEIKEWNPGLSDRIKVGDKIKIAKN